MCVCDLSQIYAVVANSREKSHCVVLRYETHSHSMSRIWYMKTYGSKETVLWKS
jgi:hypothetical protein